MSMSRPNCCETNPTTKMLSKLTKVPSELPLLGARGVDDLLQSQTIDHPPHLKVTSADFMRVWISNQQSATQSLVISSNIHVTAYNFNSLKMMKFFSRNTSSSNVIETPTNREATRPFRHTPSNQVPTGIPFILVLPRSQKLGFFGQSDTSHRP